VTVEGIGYEGFTLDAFVDGLRARRVDVLVDVRLRASSRKPGFAKSRLRAAVEDVGIEYVHEPGLGNPPDNRDAFRARDTAAWDRYRSSVDPDALARVAEIARSRRVVLMCVERDAETCHRAALLEMLAQL
jgi:uncharacterized protein (DUF488 family)